MRQSTIDALNLVTERTDTMPAQACPCTILTEVADMLPWLDLIVGAAIPPGTDDDNAAVLRHLLILAAAGGYALGVTDALDGLRAVTTLTDVA